MNRNEFCAGGVIAEPRLIRRPLENRNVKAKRSGSTWWPHRTLLMAMSALCLALLGGCGTTLWGSKEVAERPVIIATPLKCPKPLEPDYPPAELMLPPGALIPHPEKDSPMTEFARDATANFSEYRTVRRRLIMLQTYIRNQRKEVPGDL